MNVLVKKSLSCFALMFAFATSAQANEYHFTYQPDSRDRNCCSATAVFSELDDGGMNLGVARLGIAESSFRYKGRFGENSINLKANIDSKVSGKLHFDYRFLCDASKSEHCPESGEIKVYHAFDLNCGLRDNKGLRGSVDLNTSDRLNQIMLGLPDGALLDGYVNVYVANQTKCF